MSYPEASEQERFPILTPSGRSLLYGMRQHRFAPIWNWPNGEQLNHRGLEQVRAFADELERISIEPQGRPSWLETYASFCMEEVPFYRQRLASSGEFSYLPFENIPTCDRADIAPRVWDFVPDPVDLDELVTFCTSGTTGHSVRMVSHPTTAACGIPLIEKVLKRDGIGFPRGPEGVALTNIASYPGAYTTAIVIAYLEEAGCIRVNLHPSAWRDPEDAHRFINAWRAPIWLGDPIAFQSIEEMPIEHSPQAIVSSIMHLSPAYEAHLGRKYGCPIYDLYAMTEVGIVGVRTPLGHEVLPHDLYVEILGETDDPLPEGERGEVTVTCSRNPYMALLRYRTGDYASIRRAGGKTYLVGLEGRAPVLFRLPSGKILHSMEVTRLMRRYPAVQYRLHQEASGAFRFGYRGLFEIQSLRAELGQLLEKPEGLEFEELPEPSGRSPKIEVYRSPFPIEST